MPKATVSDWHIPSMTCRMGLPLHMLECNVKRCVFYFPINFVAKITLFYEMTKQSKGKITFFPFFLLI